MAETKEKIINPVIRQYEVEVPGLLGNIIQVIFKRSDSKHIIPTNGHKATKTRFRRSITCFIMAQTSKAPTTGTAICRPPDQFDVLQGMEYSLRVAVKRFIGVYEDVNKGKVANALYEGFRNYKYNREQAKKKAKAEKAGSEK